MSLPPTYELLSHHPNYYYIETGCWTGESMLRATHAYAFEIFYGIESDKRMFETTSDKFAFHHKVKIIHDDSVHGLRELLPKLYKPATFFLDAHDSLIEGEPQHPNPFPLLEELRAIDECSQIATHTIIIDDILHLTHPDVTGWKRQDIVNALLKINPNYSIRLISNPVKNNMIVAVP